MKKISQKIEQVEKSFTFYLTRLNINDNINALNMKQFSHLEKGD